MAQALQERVRQSFADNVPGLVTEAKILAAVQRIVDLAEPLRVVAFGSRARGDHHRDSDLDLAVIVEKYDSKVDERPLWRSDLREVMPVDLLVVGRERYEFMRESIISVYHDIANEGVILYDSSAGSVDHRAVRRIAR